jgi:hypothetical protein
MVVLPARQIIFDVVGDILVPGIEFAAEMMCADAGFHADQARRHVGKAFFNLATRPLLPKPELSPLSGVMRKSHFRAAKTVLDPQQTSAHSDAVDECAALTPGCPISVRRCING